MVKAGTAYVDIHGDFTSLDKGVDGWLAATTGKFGKFGKVGVAGVAAVGAAAVGAGKALFDIGASFDDAYDTIRVGTGKTGKALDGLKLDFKAVVKSVPVDFGEASKAITEINQRLGLTGRPLQNVSKQFLELSRITKTDLPTNLDAVTKVFNRWNISTGKQSKALDELFRASQRTGAPVSELGSVMARFAGPLQQFGFSFEQSAALLGTFDKAGINTTKVMGSLNIALANVAKAGGDPRKEFERITQQIKDAGTASKANAIAIDLFGKRSGPELAQAIRSGRLELGQLTGQIAGGHDTILAAAKQTDDFGEKWKTFTNKLKVFVEPVASQVFSSLGQAMDQIGPITDRVADWFDHIDFKSGTAGKALDTLRGVFNTLKDGVSGAIEVLDAIWRRFGDNLIEWAGKTIGPIIDFFQAIITVAKGLIDFIAGVFTGDWGRAWDGIKEIFSGAWNAIVAQLQIAWETAKTTIKIGVEAIVTIIKGFAGVLAAAGGWIIDQITSGIRAGLGLLEDAGSWALNQVVGGFKTVTKSLAGVGGWLLDHLENLVHGGLDGFTGIGGWIIDKIVDGLKGGANLLIGFLNDIIGVINKVPFVEFPKIPTFDSGNSNNLGHPSKGFGKGIAPNQKQTLATGGKITRPMAIVGEEAPRHPEFVIPTNPAYRGRALGLWGQLSKELGIPGFKAGGILGTLGDLASDAFDFVAHGATSFLGGLPGVGKLPDWLQNLGQNLLSSAGRWITDKVSSIFDSGTGGPGAHTAASLTHMIKAMDAIDAKGFDYVYGGGHGSFTGPYDCSGLVSAILHAGGMLGSPITTDGLKAFGEGGDGQYVTIGVRGSTGRNAHTMMRIGRRFLEAGGGHGAQWVTGWDGAFPIHRHPPGLARGGIIDQDVFKRLLGDDGLGWGLRQGGQLAPPFVGSYELGGIVPHDGLAQVHEGEAILPAGVELHADIYIGGEKIDERVDVRIEHRDRQTAARWRAGVLP